MTVLRWLRNLVLDEQFDFILKSVGCAVARGSEVPEGFGQPDLFPKGSPTARGRDYSPMLSGINLSIIASSHYRLSEPVFQRCILDAEELLYAISFDAVEGSQCGVLEHDG